MIALSNSRLGTIVRRSNYHFFLIVSAVLLASTLRFYKLGDWGLWLDEIYTVRDAFRLADKASPLSYALIRVALALFGNSEWSARLVPALIGIISIPLLYLLTKRMFNPTVGLISILLLAVSPWHLYWSQNARFYSLLFLLCNLSLLSFYLGLEKDNAKYLIISGICLTLGILTKVTAIVILPALVLYPFALKFLHLKLPAGFNLKNILFFSVLPIFSLLYFATTLFGDKHAHSLLSGEGIGGDPLRLLLGLSFHIGIPLICFTFGSLIYFVFITKSRPAVFLGVSAIAPLLLIAFASFFVVTRNRYVFVILFSWMVLGAYGIAELLSQVKGSVKVFVFGLLMALVLGALSEDIFYYRFQNGNRENWRSAFEYVRQHRTEEDLIVVTFPAAGDYYLGEKTSWIATMKPEDIELSGQRVWFVENDAIDWDYPGIQAWVKENAREVANYDVHISSARSYKMRVLLYDPITP